MTKKWPQNGPRNRPTIDLGVNLAPKRGPRESKRAPETEFGRFLIDLGPNFDRFWTDLGPNLDRFATTFLPRISSQCKLLKHVVSGIAEAFSEWIERSSEAIAYFAFGEPCQFGKRHLKDRRLTIKLVLDNVGTWKASKPGKQQHGQLGKHQLGTHKPNTSGLAGLAKRLEIYPSVTLIRVIAINGSLTYNLKKIDLKLHIWNTSLKQSLDDPK